MSDSFACDKCGCVDMKSMAGFQQVPNKLYCSLCNSGRWHNHFPRERYNPEVDLVCNRPNNIGMSSRV